MRIFRGCLILILLVLVFSFSSVVQKNQAAGDNTISSYIPMALREEDMLYSIGPQGGSIVVMEMDPNDSGILYAGTWGSGMYKSFDGGLSWQAINNGLTCLYINSLAIDPQNPAILYAGTYEYGVFKTTNGGETWMPTGPGMSEFPIVYALAVDPVTPYVLYAGTRNQQTGPPWGGGLYKSINSGETWKKCSKGMSEDWVYDIAIDPSDHNTIYAATHSKGVFKTTSAADYWAAINKGISDLSTRSLAIDPTDTQIVYVGTWHYGGVFKTVNGGDGWKSTSSGYYKIYSINMDPTDPNTIYAATYRKGIIVTRDAGASWHNTGLYPDMVYNVMIDPRRNSTLFAGTMGDGFYISYDRGENWGSANTGFRAAQVTGVAAHWTSAITSTLTVKNTTQITSTIVDALYTSVYGAGIYKTTDLGKNWLRIDNGLGELWVHSIAMSRTDPRTLYIGTDSTGFYFTNDGGVNWIASNKGLPEPAITEATFNAWLDPDLRADLFDQAFFEESPDQGDGSETASKVAPILAIAVDSFDPQKLYIGTEAMGIFRSENGGARWIATNLKIHTVYTILSDPFTTGVLYAGCDKANNTLFRSLDGGVSWKLSNVGMAGLSVYALAADPATPGVLYAGTSWGIYRSVDSAGSWEPFGLSGQIISALGIYPSDPETIFAGTSLGLNVTHDGGATWEPLNDGLINKEICCLALDPSGMPLVDLIGSRAGGIYRHGIVPSVSK
jgi:photosystem II stability/assembly factor-like uncharacterized protein